MRTRVSFLSRIVQFRLNEKKRPAFGFKRGGDVRALASLILSGKRDRGKAKRKREEGRFA